jgi:hypothetical protein
MTMHRDGLAGSQRLHSSATTGAGSPDTSTLTLSVAPTTASPSMTTESTCGASARAGVPSTSIDEPTTKPVSAASLPRCNARPPARRRSLSPARIVKTAVGNERSVVVFGGPDEWSVR